jgi:hypothetical protein
MASILDHHFNRRHGKVLPDGAPHVQHDHLKNQGRGPRPAGGCIPFRKGVNKNQLDYIIWLVVDLPL